MHKIRYISILLIVLHFSTAQAATYYDAASCGSADIESAISSCNGDGECTLVNVPSGPCAWTDDVDVPSLNHELSIVAAGVGSTVITLANGINGIVSESSNSKYVRVSGFEFLFANASSSIAITVKQTQFAGFRIDNNKFYGHSSTGGMVQIKYCWQGSFDYNYLEDNDPGVNSPYGFTAGEVTAGYPACTDWSDMDCQADWDTNYWDNSSLHGIAFDENYIPGGNNAVFIEHNEFKNMRSAVMFNWGNKTPAFIRHNWFHTTVDQISGASAKPGSPWFEVSYNIFEGVGGSYVGIFNYMRSVGAVHDNYYLNVNRPGDLEPTSGYSYSKLFTHQVQLDEFFLWNNTYSESCHYKGNCFSSDTNCGWEIVTTYNTEGIDYSANYVFRQPSIAAGDRFDWPAEPDCPNVYTGLSGGCNSTPGFDGYNVGEATTYGQTPQTNAVGRNVQVNLIGRPVSLGP